MPHIRALPWANRQEIAQLYAWIWDDPEDRESTERAVARLSTYLQSPSQPQFIPIIHALLTALLLPYPAPTPTAHLTARLTLGAALTRFVNSLVDPLQTRTYARPITHIARELGLPEGLVALRHAVTHEDLPSLGVLRHGAEAAVEWLRIRVLGPAVFDSLPIEDATQGWEGEEAFRDALARYKKLIKSYYRQRTTKGAALASVTTGGWEGARELRMVMRQVEDLLVAAVEGKDDDGREKVGRTVVRVLLASEGGMIPSLRKRTKYDPAQPDALPSPTLASLRIWTPILQLLKDKLTPPTTGDDDTEESDESLAWAEWFITECATLIRSLLHSRESHTPPPAQKEARATEGHEEEDYWIVPSVEDAPVEETDKADTRGEEKTTYLAALAGWLVYALTCASAPPPVESGNKKRKRNVGEDEGMQAFTIEDPVTRTRVVREVVGRVVGDDGVRVVKDAVAVYEGRSEGDPAGPRAADVLAALMRVDETCREVLHTLAAGDLNAQDQDLDVSEMEHRITLFRKMMAARAPVAQADAGEEAVQVDGWVKLGPGKGWKECPIGYWRG